MGFALGKEGDGAGALPNWNPPVDVLEVDADAAGSEGAPNLNPPALVVVTLVSVDADGAANLKPLTTFFPLIAALD